MFKNYLKITFRNLVKNKIYAFINIGGLALGMATAVLLLLWVQNESRFDAYHQKADQIYRINTHLKMDDKETWHWSSTPLKLVESLKAAVPEVEAATRLNMPYGDFTFNVNNAIFGEKKAAFVDKNWFEIFDYQFVKGNAQSFRQDKNNVVITEASAKKYFGDDNPIGKVMKHDSLNFVVQAVVRDVPSNSSFPFEVIMQNEVRLLNPETLENESNWGNFNYQSFVVCPKGLDTKSVSEKLTKLIRTAREDKEGKTTLELQPLTDIHFENKIESEGLVASGDRTILTIFSIVALFILLIACINYINLTTARASQRTKEVGIKKLIGASRSSLFNQFFIESCITSLLAALIAVVLINFGLPLLSSITEAHFSWAENPIIWVVLGLTTAASIALTGVYPSVLLSALQPIKLLRGRNVRGASNASFRKGLVVFQFTFTIVLLIGTFLMFKQLSYIQGKQLGYDKEHVFTMQIPWNVKNAKGVIETMTQKLKVESSVQDVTKSSSIMVDVKNTHSGSLNWTGKDPNTKPTTTLLNMDAHFPDFYKLKLADGRWFEEANKADDNNVVLNETAVKQFNIPPPVVGQYFELHGRKGQILGVAKDFHFHSPREVISPIILFRQPTFLSTISVKTMPNQFQKSIATAERIWKELVPEMAFKYEFLDESYDKLHRSEAKLLSLFNAFAFIVLLISCFGLFGLATFSAETRIKEIGIRKVLGASVGSIVNLLSKDFLVLVVAAFVVASPIAWWLVHKWLENYAYHIDISSWVFVGVGLFIVAIALATVSFQAIKAAVANPVKSLRTE